MNEEELFYKLFPEYAVNGKPLSPYFDLFERGYEEAENRIEELEEVRSRQAELINKDTIRMENQKYQIKKLEKENAELKLKLEALEGQIPWKDIKDKSELIKENVELKEELQKWKDEWQEQVQKATDEGYARTLQTVQLTKAKELLKGWLGDFYSPKAFYQQRAELVEQSEQFLKESEVEK